MKIRVILLSVAVVAVVTMTIVTYSDLGTFVFNRGSDVFTVRRIPMKGMLAVAALALLLPTLMLRRGSMTHFVAVLIVSLTVWLLFGRAVAISWQGELAGGWFCFRTNTIELLEPNDGEDYAKSWRVVALSGWRLELLREGGRAERLFVGPVLMKRALKLLDGWGFEMPLDGS